MKRTIVFAMMLAFMTGPVMAGEIAFRPAVHKTADRGIETQNGDAGILFREFSKIDWERLARTHFKAFPLMNLSTAQIRVLASRKNMFGNAEFRYLAPLTRAYRRARFIFLSADGFRKLRALGLRGTVRYRLGDAKRAPSTAFFGNLIGVPDPNNLNSGGFVALLEDGQDLLSENIVGPKIPELEPVNPYKKLKILRQIRYRFTGADSAYLFVQYAADTACAYACCQFSYVLFREDPKTHGLSQLQSSLYGCDV